MNATLAASFIAAITALLVASATYWFAKRNELESDLRKERLAYYKSFMESLIDTIDHGTHRAAKNSVAFGRACNNLQLFAPPAVLSALDAFLAIEDKKSGNYETELTLLLSAIRRDLGVPRSKERHFRAKLWS